MTGAWYRFIKVIYALVLIGGLVMTAVVWQRNEPYNHTTFGHYLISCNNGLTFDPSSKPIKKTIVNGEPVFDDFYIKSECATTYFVRNGREEVFGALFSRHPYKLSYQTYQHVRTRKQQLTTSAAVLIGYYLGAELLRRAFLYIVFGSNLLTLRRGKAKDVI